MSEEGVGTGGEKRTLVGPGVVLKSSLSSSRFRTGLWGEEEREEVAGLIVYQLG